MAKTTEDIIKLIKEQDIKMVDFRLWTLMVNSDM